MSELKEFLEFLARDNNPDVKTNKFRARLHDALADFFWQQKQPKRKEMDNDPGIF